MSWIGDEVLRELGFNEAQVAQLKEMKVDALHIVDTIKALNPRIARVGLALEMLLQVLNEE